MAMGMLTIRHAFAALAVRHKENVNRILLAQAYSGNQSSSHPKKPKLTL
jgi:hypothetical protein